MGEKGQEKSAIARSRQDGWHFRPDWRSAIVESYLIEKGLAHSPEDVLRDEQDCYVRQLYFFRRRGRCLEQSAFKWAYDCNTHNEETGAGSLLKALTVARVPAEEIAEKLRSKCKNVIVFQ